MEAGGQPVGVSSLLLGGECLYLVSHLTSPKDFKTISIISATAGTLSSDSSRALSPPGLCGVRRMGLFLSALQPPALGTL